MIENIISNMIIRNSQEEELLKEACNISVDILQKLGQKIKEGVTPLQIDNYAGELCLQYKVHPSFKRVDGYMYNTCISVIKKLYVSWRAVDKQCIWP